MNIQLLKLGTRISDSATKLKGMLTHVAIGIDQHVYYLFQPEGLNPEDGQPSRRIWIVHQRVIDGERHEVDIPFEVLGTEVRDAATGFAGMAIELQMHVSGCLHVLIQPAGVVKKTNAIIESADFDIRRCEGKAIKRLTDEERERDQRAHPSPIPVPPEPDSSAASEIEFPLCEWCSTRPVVGAGFSHFLYTSFTLPAVKRLYLFRGFSILFSEVRKPEPETT